MARTNGDEEKQNRKPHLLVFRVVGLQLQQLSFELLDLGMSQLRHGMCSQTSNIGRFPVKPKKIDRKVTAMDTKWRVPM
jgi:hypothetical protein